MAEGDHFEIRVWENGDVRVELHDDCQIAVWRDGSIVSSLDPITAYFLAQAMGDSPAWFADVLREATNIARDWMLGAGSSSAASGRTDGPD